MVPAPFEVVGKRRDTADVWTLELEARSGEALAFEPGQFTMLAARGAGEVPISIGGDADSPQRLVHTVRAVGLATKAVCAAELGDVLSVRGPFGRPWPVDELRGADLVIVAGGIGLPPLRPAILRILARREQYGRLVLLYGGRNPEELLFSDELDAWSARGVEVMVTVDSAASGWTGHVGVVTRLVRRAKLEPRTLVAMTCGPEVMMRFLAAALADQGVGSERMYASMERNMQCGIGHCGHCQLGPTLVCRDGPVYQWSQLEHWVTVREL
ncbi:MAG: FAD/NAD(P)-binding protein [Solirubrobacteraceae bacterium]|jgi:NAD(P)H-flavin reductase